MNMDAFLGAVAVGGQRMLSALSKHSEMSNQEMAFEQELRLQYISTQSSIATMSMLVKKGMVSEREK
eukprot:2509837-Pyramimonas_sp.AAC.1